MPDYLRCRPLRFQRNSPNGVASFAVAKRDSYFVSAIADATDDVVMTTIDFEYCWKTN